MLYATDKMTDYELNNIVMGDKICFEFRNSKSKVI